MNFHRGHYEKNQGDEGFRPQQGLPIMNHDEEIDWETKKSLFPSPTGATYYESLPTKP